MPVRKIQLGQVRSAGETQKELGQRLADEWSEKESAEPRPEIREEVEGERVVHLYVIWSEWAGIDHQLRSEVIMDAFIATHGKEAALDVTVAMGVTPEEAKRMGID